MDSISGESAYLFRHAMVREGAYQLILPENRQSLHRLALEILDAAVDSLTEDIADSWAAEMADHAMIAAESGDDADTLRQREFELRVRAGRVAQARFDLRQAMAQFERALTIREDVALLVDACEAAITSGRYELAEMWSLRAHELAAPGKEDALASRALSVLARVAVTGGDFERAHDLLRRALDLAEGQRVSMVEGSIGTVYSAQGKQKEAADIFRAGVAHAREAADRPLLASALTHLADAEYRTGHFEKARQTIDEAIALLRETGELSSLASSLARLSIIAADLGDRDVEASAALEAEQLARRIGYERMVAILTGNRGTSEFERGNMREAARLYQEAEKINREIGHQLGIAANITNRGGVLREAGDIKGALACADEALALARRMGHNELAASNLGKRGVLLLLLGRPREARDALEEGMQVLKDGGIEQGFDSLTILGALAEACRELGEAEAAQSHVRAFRTMAETMHVGPGHHNPSVREAFARVDATG